MQQLRREANVSTYGKAVLIGVLVGALVGLALLPLTTGLTFAQTPPATPTPRPSPTPGTPFTHEQMDQMMDAMHGPGTSQRMHEAMGPDAERLMDQCVSTMSMMQQMSGLMPNMQGTMGGVMSGVTGDQQSQAMPGMMSRMMGR